MEQIGAGKVDLSGCSIHRRAVGAQDDRIEIMLAQNPAQNPAQNIDEVIARLTDIIDISRREPGRLGYFAALYRNVTISVKNAILNGRFEDGERMEMLDVNFANRYLEAYELHSKGETPTASWQVSFEAAGHWRPLILQHLLLGINAHINLDLGIAVA